MCVRACVRACVFVRACVRMCVCVCSCMRASVCLFVCVKGVGGRGEFFDLPLTPNLQVSCAVADKSSICHCPKDFECVASSL